MKKNNIYLMLWSILMTIAFTSCTVANYISSSKYRAYKAYYDKAEALFDEIEEDNEAYFDTDKGEAYLHQRAIIMKKYK